MAGLHPRRCIDRDLSSTIHHRTTTDDEWVILDLGTVLVELASLHDAYTCNHTHTRKCTYVQLHTNTHAHTRARTNACIHAKSFSAFPLISNITIFPSLLFDAARWKPKPGYMVVKLNWAHWNESTHGSRGQLGPAFLSREITTNQSEWLRLTSVKIISSVIATGPNVFRQWRLCLIYTSNDV